MKKWFCSSIVIISTITTCILLNIILDNDSYINNPKEMTIIIKEIESSSNEINNSSTEKSKIKTNEVEENSIIKHNEETSDKEALRIAKQEYFMGVGDGEEVYNVNSDLDNCKSVFKVDSRTIVNNLSMMDKLKLLSISSKLSKTDYKKVDGYLKEDNAEEGVKKAYRVLKEKLNDNDMNKIKDILERYIDVEVIEKK